MSHQCKKQKLDKSVQDPVVYFDFRRISNKIWDEIFQHITGKNLLRLSLVCKNFYEAIGKSSVAMDKIMLKVDKNNDKKIVNLSRNYTNIKFQLDSKIEACKDIFQKYGRKLKTLEIYYFDFKYVKNVIDILASVKNNLRTLKILIPKMSGKLYDHTIKTHKTFELAMLEKLELIVEWNPCDTLEILVDFLPGTIKQLDCSFSYYMTIETSFLKILEKQNNLKRLNIRARTILDYFNDTEISDDIKIKFRLETLSLKLFNFTKSSEKLNKFLKTQAESLKFLTLKNISLHEFHSSFEYMPQLQVLEITYSKDSEWQYESGPNFSCPSLKKLIVNFKDCNENLSLWTFIKRFPNAEVVAITNGKYKLLESCVKNHIKLKKLVLTKFYDGFYFYLPKFLYEPISFEHLSELIIIETSEDLSYDWKDNHGYSDITLDTAILTMENLKVLKLREKILLSMKSLLWILLNFKNLKHLEIDNGRKLEVLFLCRHSYHFRNLRYLKIKNMVIDSCFDSFAACMAQYPSLNFNLKHCLYYWDRNGNDENCIDNYNDYI